MGLDDFTPVESSEGGSQSSEVSEAFKEAFKKGSAGIKRTQKDEKKAKRHDVLLAGFLVKIIIDKRYDPLLTPLFACMNKGFSSNFLLGILSLIHKEISDEIRKNSHKPQIVFQYNAQEASEFDDAHIHSEIRDRINFWVEDCIDIVSIDHSSIQTKNTLLFIEKENKLIVEFISKVFTFFLNEINISITEKKSQSISEFILGQIEGEIKKLPLDTI